jgi:hypothetical protein
MKKPMRKELLDELLAECKRCTEPTLEAWALAA